MRHIVWRALIPVGVAVAALGAGPADADCTSSVTYVRDAAGALEPVRDVTCVATEEEKAAIRKSAAELNPNAPIIEARMPVSLSEEDQAKVKGARVLVVEDGPTVTHGGMKTGAGTIAAEKFGAAEIIDPRPFLKGLLAGTFEKYPDIGKLVPAMGYSDEQIADLEASINASDADLVIVGTPINLGGLIKIDKPHVWATYDMEFPGSPNMQEQIDGLLKAKGLM